MAKNNGSKIHSLNHARHNEKVFKKNYSKLFSELRYVKDERNKFAHYVHYLRDEPTDSITLLNFRDVIMLVDYDKEKYNLLIKRIDRCFKEVREMVHRVHEFLPAQYADSSAT